MIYFDNAATTFPKGYITEHDLHKALYTYSFNAGRGNYEKSAEVSDMIEQTREAIASFIQVPSSCVVLLSGATEAMNSIIKGLDIHEGDYVYVSPFEHNSVIRPLVLSRATVKMIDFNVHDGSVNYGKLKTDFILYPPKAVFITQISNAVGFSPSYDEIFRLAKKSGAITVQDAVQGFGIYPIITDNVDFLVFSSHKSLYSVFGSGGYINISGVPLLLYKAGGSGSDSLSLYMSSHSPERYEAGSPNSFAISLLKHAVEFVRETDIKGTVGHLTEYFLERLTKVKKALVYTAGNNLPCGIVSMNIKGLKADECGAMLEKNGGILVRTGYHCAPYIHTLFDIDEYGGMVRVSFGAFNTESQIDTLIDVLKEI